MSRAERRPLMASGLGARPPEPPQAYGGDHVPAWLASSKGASCPGHHERLSAASPGFARPSRARDRVRLRARDLLWSASDRLCARGATFTIGHWLGELGWKLRRPRDGGR